MIGLFDAITSFDALCRAARRAARGKNISQRTARFLVDLEPEVLGLQRELRSGVYRPRAYHTFRIRDPKPRTISAAHFRDRVVHHALCAGVEPLFERAASDCSFACRRGKGSHAAIRRARAFAGEAPWFLKLDIQSHFETIDHAVLEQLVADRVADERTRVLAARFIHAGAPGSAPGKGLPIGNLTSQHFANLYLTPLDHFIVATLRPSAYLRYMDDLLLFGLSRAALDRCHAAIGGFLARELRLALRHDATRREPVHAGVPFLGFRIWPNLIRFDGRRSRRFRRKVRRLRRLCQEGAMSEDEAAASGASLIGWSQGS